jgi:hypothetical protein
MSASFVMLTNRQARWIRMKVSLEIPDEAAGRTARDGGDLSRLALETILAEEPIGPDSQA